MAYRLEVNGDYDSDDEGDSPGNGTEGEWDDDDGRDWEKEYEELS